MYVLVVLQQHELLFIRYVVNAILFLHCWIFFVSRLSEQKGSLENRLTRSAFLQSAVIITTAILWAIPTV